MGILMFLSIMILQILKNQIMCSKISGEVKYMFVNFDFSITPVRVCSSYRLLSSPLNSVTHNKNRKCWGIVLKAGKTLYRQGDRELLSDSTHVMLLPKGGGF